VSPGGLCIAVTGAAGRLGAEVVALLAAGGRADVVAVARRAPPLPAGATWRAADYDDPPALRAAFSGAATLVFVTSDGELPAVMRHHANIADAAGAAGVRHVVALSTLDADARSPFCYAEMAARTEALLRAGGAALSIVRASIYVEFFCHWLDAARLSGVLRLPGGAGRISLVGRSDVARCLAALALRPALDGVVAATGPEALGLGEIATRAAAAWGRPIEYVDVSAHEFAAETARAGEEAWWLYAFSTMFASIREDRWATVTTDVAEICGRPPAALEDLIGV